MKFTDTHEWVELEGEKLARIGITDYAQKELGDIVYAELPKLDSHVTAKQQVAVLESTKAAADIYSPVSGKIVEVNQALIQQPELINQAAEKGGWIYKIQLTDLSEIKQLMDKSAYEALLHGA